MLCPTLNQFSPVAFTSTQPICPHIWFPDTQLGIVYISSTIHSHIAAYSVHRDDIHLKQPRFVLPSRLETMRASRGVSVSHRLVLVCTCCLVVCCSSLELVTDFESIVDGIEIEYVAGAEPKTVEQLRHDKREAANRMGLVTSRNDISAASAPMGLFSGNFSLPTVTDRQETFENPPTDISGTQGQFRLRFSINDTPIPLDVKKVLIRSAGAFRSFFSAVFRLYNPFGSHATLSAYSKLTCPTFPCLNARRAPISISPLLETWSNHFPLPNGGGPIVIDVFYEDLVCFCSP